MHYVQCLFQSHLVLILRMHLSRYAMIFSLNELPKHRAYSTSDRMPKLKLDSLVIGLARYRVVRNCGVHRALPEKLTLIYFYLRFRIYSCFVFTLAVCNRKWLECLLL